MRQNPIMNDSDLEALEQSILHCKYSTYPFLEEAQHVITNYHRFDFKSSDLQVTQDLILDPNIFKGWYYLSINKSFIDISDRLKYKASSFYSKYLTLYEIAHNPDIFKFNILFFINGYALMKGVKVMPNEDRTILILSYDETSFVDALGKTYNLNDIVKGDFDISVFIVPNYNYESTTVSSSYITLNKTIDLNKVTMDAAYTAHVDVDYFNFGTFVPSGSLSLMEVTEVGSTISFPVPSSFNKGEFALSRVGLKHFKERISVPANTEIVRINSDTPILPCAVLPFKRDINGNLIFAHEVKISKRYPYYFRLSGNTMNIELFVFYKEGGLEGYKYHNVFELYERFIKDDNIKSQIVTDTLPNFLKNYTPSLIDYTNVNFSKSDYYEKYDGDVYKVEKFREIFNEDEIRLDTYLDNLITSVGDWQVIDCSNLNLDDRTFDDDSIIIDDPSSVTTFSEPHVLIVFNHLGHSEFVTRRITLDSVLINDSLRYWDDHYDYYFIPRSKVKDNSIIETETSNAFEWSSDKVFKSMSDEYNFEATIFKNDIHIDDLFITDENDKYIDRSDYSIYIQDKDDKWVIINYDQSSYETIKKIKVKLINSELLNKTLIFHMTSTPMIQSVIVNTDLAVPFATFMNCRCNNHNIGEHVSVYKNGRLIPDEFIKITKVNNYFGDTISVLTDISGRKGDRFDFYLTPVAKKLINRTLSTERGLMNFRGIVNKTINQKWYEIYVNGYKLNMSNCEILSATRIHYSNIPSNKYIEIYERNLNKDNEYELATTGPKSIEDKIWDYVSNNYPGAIEKEFPLIEEDVNDDFIKPLEPITSQFILFYKTFALDFINPNKQQITADMQSAIPLLLNSDGNLFINPNKIGLIPGIGSDGTYGFIRPRPIN